MEKEAVPTKPIKLRGKVFSPDDIAIIKQCVKSEYSKGRTYISKKVCELLDWKQPNGWLKDRACRDVLIKLEGLGLIQLPPAKVKKKTNDKESKKRDKNSILSEFDLVSPIDVFPTELQLKFSKGDKYEEIWNRIVEEYHYLGYQVAVGRSIKYLVLSGERIVGAVGFSSPAYKLKIRDEILSRLGINNVHDIIINNTRFLLLPYVTVPNLASHVLARATKQVVIDWTWYYSITPLIAETFVQPSLFDGACYKAANWVEVGSTKGFAKRGSSHHNSQEPKYVFLYGLTRKYRRLLQQFQSSGENSGSENLSQKRT